MICGVNYSRRVGERASQERGKTCHSRSRSISPHFHETFLVRSGQSFDVMGLATFTSSVRGWSRFCMKNPRSRLPKRPAAWGCRSAGFGNGETDGRARSSRWKTNREPGVPRFFPPKEIAIIKAVACELPARHNQPLSRLFIPDIQRIVIAEKRIDSISAATIWRILDGDALKPWRRRSWIWSRDPFFYERAAPILDLYQGIWRGRRLHRDEFVVSADEKTSIQARNRLHPTEVHSDGRGQRVEHEYERGGAWAYLAALDVHRAKIIGHVEDANGIAPFQRLVRQVMRREPYASARRVFWIVDQGSSHRPTTFPDRIRNEFRNAVAVMLPVHASWLNQIEIYFSILQRKALTPNDFPNLHAVAERIRDFAKLFMRTAKPFNWRFTRHDLRALLHKLPDTVLTHEAQNLRIRRKVG